jgi:hypothetical protein
MISEAQRRLIVIPAKAGIHTESDLDPGLRRGGGLWGPP